MCRLEEQMISEALGQPVHLSSCRLDGDACCQFSAVTDRTTAAVDLTDRCQLTHRTRSIHFKYHVLITLESIHDETRFEN